MTELGKAAATLDGSQSDLFGTVSNLQGFNDTLVKNDQGVATLNDRLSQVSTTLAQDKSDYAAAVQQLGQALALVQAFVRDNRASIKGSVDGLQSTAATLAAQKAALEKISATVPADLQNFLDAYDPSTGTLNSRGDLNEIGVWGQGGGAAAAAPPTFLPSVTGAKGGTRDPPPAPGAGRRPPRPGRARGLQPRHPGGVRRPAAGRGGRRQRRLRVTAQFSDVLDLVPQSAVKLDDVPVGRVDGSPSAPTARSPT